MTAPVISPWSWLALVPRFESSSPGPRWGLSNSSALWPCWTWSLEISAGNEWQGTASLPWASGQWCWCQGAVLKLVGRQAAWAKVLFLEAPATHLRRFPEAWGKRFGYWLAYDQPWLGTSCGTLYLIKDFQQSTCQQLTQPSDMY